jgi:hypothetical protein
MLRFHGVELSERSYYSSTGREEIASVEHRIAAGHLQDTVGLSIEILKGKINRDNERFILFISFNTW